MIEESSPDGKQAHEPGAKLDAGKPLVLKGFIDYFPEAIQYVSKILRSNDPSSSGNVACIFPGMGEVLREWFLSIENVAAISEIGANKYCWKGWRDVDNALERYSDALGRHELKRFHEDVDADYGTLHEAHAAWNAWAILEILLEDRFDDTESHVAGAFTVVHAMNILEERITRSASISTKAAA